MDQYKIDSHKLMYHVDRVNRWMKGEVIYPIYLEVSPIGACNHRCTFCGLDFMKYKVRKISCDVFCRHLPEMANIGIKSIMYAGEGEPFLHKEMASIIRLTKENSIDVAVTSNGVMFIPRVAEQVLPHCSWIKFSVNAGTPDTYAKIHRTAPEDFQKVIANLKAAAELRRASGSVCTLGAQILLLPEVAGEIEELVKRVKDIGMDYLVVKPYSQHPQSITDKYKNIVYSKFLSRLKTLDRYNDNNFSVIVRFNTMQDWDNSERRYKKCLGLPFWSYIDAGGNVWGCSMYLNDERFRYGNINDRSFREIWTGKERRASLEFVDNELLASACRVNCRMNYINQYLWDLKYPGAHINFI